MKANNTASILLQRKTTFDYPSYLFMSDPLSSCNEQKEPKWSPLDRVTYYGHPQTIEKLKQEARLDGYDINILSCDFVVSASITKPAPVDRKQDRRKNKRIQARKRLREKRSPRIPDDVIYALNNSRFMEENKKLFGYIK